MKGKMEKVKKALVVLESLGVGLFYIAMLAFFLYPVVDSAGYFS